MASEIENEIPELKATLCNHDEKLALRMRALWRLRDIGTEKAAAAFAAALDDESALLRHELCYVMGQLGLECSIPVLNNVLDTDVDCMVRHEAAEALGAIGSVEALPILEKYVKDAAPEVSETCQVSLDRIKWMMEHPKNGDVIYGSVDPAPPHDDKKLTVPQLREILLNEEESTFQRYRALFALRDLNTSDAVLAIVDALHGGSDLFKHEVAFVLGQMENPEAAPALQKVVANHTAHAMVRHEAAEALGSIATDDSLPFLESYLKDNVPAVRESCEVAMDMHHYWSQFKAPQVIDDE